MADQQEPKRNWWGRNWKWVVPTGCLGMVLLLVGGCATIIFGVFGLMKSSDAYKGAMVEIRNSPAAQQALGSPIEAGLMVSGNININGSGGQADLTIPVSGPEGSGTLYVKATRSEGTWRYDSLTLKTKAGDTINVLPPGAEGPPQ